MRSAIKRAVHKGWSKAFGRGAAANGADGHIITFDKHSLEAYYHENERVRLYNEGLKRAGVEWSDNFAKQCRFYSLQQLVQWMLKEGLEGDVAECGCWKGHSTFMMARLLADSGFAGGFHVFDAFEGGLSDRGDEDEIARYQQSERQIQREKEQFASAEDQVADVLREFDFVQLYKGWIPERFGEVDERRFAFVHIDVDLYQPTLDSLRFFFPRLVDGGVIVVDDYGGTHFPGAKKAVDEQLAENNCRMFYEVPTGGCFLIK